jgi:uncharacterized protein YkwD
MKKLLVAFFLLASRAAFAVDANEITVENVLRQMNAHRAAASLPALRADEKLTRAANDRMRHMEEEAFWGHTSPDGLSPFTWVTLRSYEYRAVAENLANGFDTAAVLVESWMESPGHRANILSADFEDCGIAIIEGSTTGRATGRSVVVLFAKPTVVRRAHVQ